MTAPAPVWMDGPLVFVKATKIVHAVAYLGDITGRTRCGWRFLHPNTGLTVLPASGAVNCPECIR